MQFYQIGELIQMLRQRRIALGYEPAEVDARMAVKVGSVARWETRKRNPPPYRIWGWLEALGLAAAVVPADPGETGCVAGTKPRTCNTQTRCEIHAKTPRELRK